ncbi:MAG: enoyl-CoA hydratase/isomerase family protein [Porticoccaceae bacterium]
MSKPSVTTQIDRRGVATVTLVRPERHNAFDDIVIAELSAAFQDVARDERARVMVLAATGKHFSAGADLAWMRRMGNASYDANLADAEALANMLRTLNELPKPTIARVQGSAWGGALGLICCCDLAVAAGSATFRFTEVRLGLVPATISPYVIAAIGPRAARRYFLSAEPIEAETARNLGLLSAAVDESQLDHVVENWIDSLLRNGPQAMAEAKQLIASIAGKTIDDQLVWHTSETIARMRVSQEGQEGLSAFLEKRPPSWRQAP